jgi:hypothetical protein
VTSDIYGLVRDPSGSVVRDAHIRAIQTTTNLDRETQSDALGNYRIAGLGPGTYRLQVEHEGFDRLVVNDILLEVNAQVQVNLDLQIGSVKETVEVDGHAAMVEAGTAQSSGLVGARTLVGLPLNGRDLFQLTLLETGVLPTTNAGPSPWGDGGLAKASVEGARPTMNNINLDGGDINDPGFNIPPGGASGVQMGVEAIREFRVLLSGFSAEYGRNAGANIQLVTKSGTNELHGSLYEFSRNAALDARNFFDGSGTPPFVRNQFGASAGGPIVRNRTFFFANYEGLRESRSVNAGMSVPDANVRSGLLPSALDPSVLVNVGVDPRVKPFLDLFPLPNGPSVGGGLSTLQTVGEQQTRADYGLIRLNHRLSHADDLFVRYVVDDSNALVPFHSTFLPGFPADRTVRNQYGMLSWQHTISPYLLNEAKFNFTRPDYVAAAANTYPLSLGLPAHRDLGTINISSLPALGNSVGLPFGTTSNVFEGIENLSWQHGSHLLKMGGDLKRTQVNGAFDLFSAGLYLFTDLTPFGLPAQSNNPALEFFLRGIPLAYIGVDPSLSDSSRGFRQTYGAAYFQDDYRLRRDFTLNVGLRWEYWSNPTEAHGRIANIHDLANDTAPTIGKLWESVPANQFSPRLGFAWTPAGGKTAVRGSFSLMRDQIWSNLYFNVRFYEPFYKPLEYILPTFTPSPANVSSLIGIGGPPSVIGSFGITYRPDFPYYLQTALNVQRELTPDLLLQVSYAGSRGNHLVRTGEANPSVPSLGHRLNPNFGSIPLVATDAQSTYHSGQVSLRNRMSHGLLFQGSYTLSKSIDDQSGPFPSDYVSESGVSQDFYNRKGSRGLSSFDRRHAFVFNSLWEIPHPRMGAGAPLLRGWALGGIVSVYSGLPFTPTLGSFNNSLNLASNVGDRPDLRPGVQGCATGNQSPNRWFDSSIFTLPAAGQYGNAGRNILCGPGLQTADLSLARAIHLSERLTLQFRAEFFNALNHANFDVPVNTQGPAGNGGNGDAIFAGRRITGCAAASDPQGCGIYAPNVGQIFRTATPSRQIQFALKLQF